MSFSSLCLHFSICQRKQRSDSPRWKRKYTCRRSRGKVLWAMSAFTFSDCLSLQLKSFAEFSFSLFKLPVRILSDFGVNICSTLLFTENEWQKGVNRNFFVNLIATSEKELSFTCTFAEMSPVFLEFQSALWHAGSWLCSFLSKFLQVKKWEMFGRKSASFNLI